MDIAKYNEQAWDNYVDQQDRWTIPVTASEIEQARAGQWNIVLTPKKTVPHSWFPANLKKLKILGLASGGGQQCPILAALGAELTVFDNSKKQLQQDQQLSEAFDLGMRTIQGDMRDLSVFPDASFDLIFNPCSILFVDDIKRVWEACYRILKPNGILMTGLMNPIAFQLHEENLNLIYPQPYSDLHSLPAEQLAQLTAKKEALIFGHSLTDQIGGQLDAGFVLSAMYEDDWGGDNKMDAFFPAFIATRAVKMPV